MQEGLSNALRLFHLTARSVPAYRDFLARHRIRPSRITADTFKTVPCMDKKNYIYHYSLPQLFSDGIIPPMIYASSGSSGRPTFWFRGDAQEETGTDIHEKIFRDIFKISKRDRTLVIICFSMGVWVAGNYTLASCRGLARRGYRISIITPGTEMDDIQSSLRLLMPQFDRVVLTGYPPFIMDVVVRALEQKIKFPRHVNILTAGDKFTEEWRTSLVRLLKTKDVLHSVVSIYGSADAGVLGFETPLAIFFRRMAMENPNLRKTLFGDDPILPALVQFDPSYIFFEEVNGELLFTTATALPLVRYNIHDVGKIVSYSNMLLLLKHFNLDRIAHKQKLLEWRLPFIVKSGRNDVAVTFYALNIYPENIKAGLEDRRVAKYVSGQFFAFNKNTHQNRNQRLCLNVELANGVKSSERIARSVRDTLVDNLVRLNIEYRKLYSVIGKQALPILKLLPFGNQRLGRTQTKGLSFTNGKKARMI